MNLIKRTKIFYKDKFNFYIINLSLLIIISTWILFIIKKIDKSSLSILHYNIYFGFDILGNWTKLFIFPGFVLFLSLVNLFLAIYFWTKNRFWSYFLLTLILLSNLITFIFVFNILNYNL